jgi:hypothetical protein
MFLIDSAANGAAAMCLTYVAADVLQRAGYSAWPFQSPCLEGRYVHLFASVDSAGETISLQGVFDDIWVARIVARPPGRRGNAMPSRTDVQLLVADVLGSDRFRQLVGRVSAAESADHFVTKPIDQTRLASLCRPGNGH